MKRLTIRIKDGNIKVDVSAIPRQRQGKSFEMRLISVLTRRLAYYEDLLEEMIPDGEIISNERLDGK